MRVLVTGGAGFIGSHLADTLKARGNEVLVIDNLASGSSRVNFLSNRGIPLDTTDIRQERLLGIVKEFSPHQICHLAAQIDVRASVSDPVTDAKINIVGLLRVLEGAVSVGARVLFASSGGTIYGEPSPDQLPISEDIVGRPTAPYGITKKVAEDYLSFYRDLYGLSSVSLALANVYGPRQDPHGEAGVVAIFALRLLQGRHCTIYGDGKQTRDFVYVEDVVEAFLAASERGDGERFNIGTGEETSVEGLLRALAQIAGKEPEVFYEQERPGELNRISLDSAKAKRDLGWEPKTTLEEGLRKTLDSLR